MPSAAAEIGTYSKAGTAAGAADPVASAPTRQAVQVDVDARLERLRFLLARAPLAHGAITAIICSYVVQHPAMVLLLMLGFPALLIAQEVVDRKIVHLAPVPKAEVQPRPGESSVAIAGATDAPRRSLPRGMTVVSDGGAGDSNTPVAA